MIGVLSVAQFANPIAGPEVQRCDASVKGGHDRVVTKSLADGYEDVMGLLASDGDGCPASFGATGLDVLE